MHCFRVLIPAVFSAALWCGAATTDAKEPLSIKQATIGLGGRFKAGYWQPLRLNIAAGPQGARGRLEVVAPDGDQMPVVYHDGTARELNLPPGEELAVWLYFKSGPVASPIRVQLVHDQAVVWSREITPPSPALASTRELVVSVGPALGLEAAAATIRRRAGGALATAHVDSADGLPDHLWGYDGVDSLVLATSDAQFIAALSDQQRRAIVDWVLLGGRIVLCAGARGGEIAAADGPWVPLLPGEFIEVDVLRERSGLEQFTKSELPFDEPFFQRNRPAVTRLKNIRGQPLVDEVSSSAGRPLVIYAPAGLGQVIFLAFDLDHPSLKDWKGRTRLLASLLELGAEAQNERQERRGISQLGYDDITGQLRAALDQFAGVSIVNFTTVSVLTCIYLLLIGPGDYLLLSQFGWPRQVTWFTFPAVALGVVALAGFMDGRLHGRGVRVNQAEIIDIDMANQLVRGTAWSHVYSPTTRPFDLRLELAAVPGVGTSSLQAWLGWQGLPGDALGGLESNQPALIPREPYTVALPGLDPAVNDLTVQVASSKSLTAGWWAKTSLAAESKLTIDRYGLLAGEFQSPLSIGLSDCLLAHGEKLYRLGALSPAQRVQMAELPPLNLEARLTQRRVEQSKDVSTPWDPESTDIPRIVQMLMFHEAARGSSYTGLTHRYQSRIDLSELVRLGQAVLVGRAASPVAQLMNGNTPLTEPENTTTYTWYRIVLPVSP